MWCTQSLFQYFLPLTKAFHLFVYCYFSQTITLHPHSCELNVFINKYNFFNVREWGLQMCIAPKELIQLTSNLSLFFYMKHLFLIKYKTIFEKYQTRLIFFFVGQGQNVSEGWKRKTKSIEAEGFKLNTEILYSIDTTQPQLELGVTPTLPT